MQGRSQLRNPEKATVPTATYYIASLGKFMLCMYIRNKCPFCISTGPDYYGDLGTRLGLHTSSDKAKSKLSIYTVAANLNSLLNERRCRACPRPNHSSDSASSSLQFCASSAPWAAVPLCSGHDSTKEIGVKYWHGDTYPQTTP